MEKEISSQRVFKGRLLGLRVDKVKLSNGVETTREIVEHPGAVAVVAVTKEKELVLIRQFRKPVNEVILEIPAGVPHTGEKEEEAARRELEEETGYYARRVKKIWEGYATPGYSNEMIHYFLAQEMTLLRPQRDEDEQMEVDLIDIETCTDLVKTGKIKDNKTMIGIALAEKYLEEHARTD
jgi:ADP-ribose pyrophosphatase